MSDLTSTTSGTPEDFLLSLNGELTISYASDLKKILADALEGAQKVTCSVEKIEEIDLTGLQLLCSAHRTSFQSGKSLEIKGVDSEHLRSSIVMAGFSRHICCEKSGNGTCLWTGGE